jgi:hypothetical protein
VRYLHVDMVEDLLHRSEERREWVEDGALLDRVLATDLPRRSVCAGGVGGADGGLDGCMSFGCGGTTPLRGVLSVGWHRRDRWIGGATSCVMSTATSCAHLPIGLGPNLVHLLLQRARLREEGGQHARTRPRVELEVSELQSQRRLLALLCGRGVGRRRSGLVADKRDGRGHIAWCRFVRLPCDAHHPAACGRCVGGG